MTKEEIYEQYWKKLVEIRRIYTGFRTDNATMYTRYRQHAVRQRDKLLQQYGFDPFKN